RAGQAAGEDRFERLALGLVGAVVDVEHEAPRRALFVVAVPAGEHDAEPVERHTVGVALEDAPRERAEADAVRGAAAHDAVDPAARTDRLAVARLEVRAGDAPGAHRPIRIGCGCVSSGTWAGVSATSSPSATSATASSRASAGPRGRTFSAKIAA